MSQIESKPHARLPTLITNPQGQIVPDTRNAAERNTEFNITSIMGREWGSPPGQGAATDAAWPSFKPGVLDSTQSAISLECSPSFQNINR